MSTSTPTVDVTTAVPETTEPTTVEKLRGLPWSIFSNTANTVFSQFTFFGSVFVLFLSYLQMDKTQIGLMLSLIPFAGLVALFIAPAVARFGYKRTYITFFGLRKVVTVALLATPFVAANFGHGVMVGFVMLVTGLFALCRAVAETGVYPWLQEYIPNSVRGKYSATNSIYTTLAGLASVAIAGFVLDRTVGLTGYMWLISAGIIFGFVSVWAATRIPGGAPVQRGQGDHIMHGMREAARDRNFLRYLAGVALMTLGTVPMISFLPLFMQEVIRLPEGQIVMLQSGTLVGHLLSSLGWGWASDRYGSKPVMLSGLALRMLLPIAWFFMPRAQPSSLYIALAIAVLVGISDMAWIIGSGRLLFVSVVPPAKKMEYMALHYSWAGVVGGISQLLGGFIIDLSAGLQGSWFGLSIDPYTPLFVLGFVLTLATAFLFQGIRADNIFGVGQFAGMFFRGNPFQAMNAMARYYAARDERSTVSVTERMGVAKSPLAVDELLEALRDPRFNVRFEAIISIARMPINPRLTAALIEVLNGTELALKAVSAWALGRVADPDAVPALREQLDAPYRSIRAHAARALGAMHERSVVPILLERLETETDKGLLMAYASALGNIQAEEAVQPLLRLLHITENPGARLELALSLARIVGGEHIFISLLRQMRADADTTAAKEIGDYRRRLEKARILPKESLQLFNQSADAFARGKREQGIALLVQGLRQLPPGAMREPGGRILKECLNRLGEDSEQDQQYLLLTLHCMRVASTV